MIDLGTPFSRSYKELIDSLEESIRQGVEQPAVQRFIYQSSSPSYELERQAYAIKRVSGIVEVKGVKTFKGDFNPGVHFRFSNNRLIWSDPIPVQPNERPLEGSSFEVEYTYREEPPGLTDFNPGSVIGTLVRAIARELGLLYNQMDQAYQRAFIDYANGVALDNVVALLGLQRNPEIPAKGQVVFFRKKVADKDYPIPGGTRVADESGRNFLTNEAAVIPVNSIDELEIPSGQALTVKNRIGRLDGVWGAAVDPTSVMPLKIIDTAPPKFPFGESETVITIDPSALPLPAGALRVRYVPKSVTVSVTAEQAGSESNVNAGAVKVMPTPPKGIEGVSNPEAISGGKPAESDEQLRDRAKHHLERLGKGTLNAIKYAILEVDGVESVQVSDQSMDSSIPLGEVRVSYSSSESAIGRQDLENRIRDLIEETRPAGVIVLLSQITKVLVGGVIYVLPDISTSEIAAASLRNAIIEEINRLEAGKPLSTRRLLALVYNIPGLVDVADARFFKINEDQSTQDISDPFLVGSTQVIRPSEDPINTLQVLVLSMLKAENPKRINASGTTPASNQVELSLITVSGVAKMSGFNLNLTLAFEARSKLAPGQPATLIGTLSGVSVKFSKTGKVKLSVNDTDIPGYDPTKHDPNLAVRITATVYPGLGSATTNFNLA